MSAEQYRLLFASGNAHLSNVVFDAFVSAGRGRVEARLVSALAQARVFATRAPCDIVLLDATLGSDLLESIAEMRRERPDLLIAVLATSPTGSQRASYLNAGARLITAVPESHEETEALLVQVISALHALRQPVAPTPPPAPTPAPASPIPAPAPSIRRSDAPLFAAPQPPATPAEAPAKPRDGLLFSAPAPAAAAQPNIRRSDAPLFSGPPPAKPVTTSIKPAAIRAAENAGLTGSSSPIAAKPSGTRTISLPVARPFAAPEPAEPPPPPPPPTPPPVAKPAPAAPAPVAEKDPPRPTGFRFTQLIKNIKPVSLPPKSEGGSGES